MKTLTINILILLVFALAGCNGLERSFRPSQEDPVVLIASWNIRFFSDGSRDDAELKVIAEILYDYDFVAVIEIRDEKVLQRTQAILQGMGKDYKYLISAPVGNIRKERYAFLYDERKVSVLQEGALFDSDEFLRAPYYATFQSGRFDFTVIATHVIWGDRVAERQREVQALSDVFQSIQERDTEEQDVILMGDFNRNPDDLEAYAPLFDIPFMEHLFNLPMKSHIRDTSLYDNILFQTHHVREFTGAGGINRFDERLFGNDDKAASLAVSDHRPVWGGFFTHQDDD